MKYIARHKYRPAEPEFCTFKTKQEKHQNQIPNIFQLLQIIQHNKWPQGCGLEHPLSKGVSFTETSNFSVLNAFQFDNHQKGMPLEETDFHSLFFRCTEKLCFTTKQKS